MKLDIYDHFHKDEREFVDRAWEWVVNAGQYHETIRTDFLILVSGSFWNRL